MRGERAESKGRETGEKEEQSREIAGKRGRKGVRG